jgi:hypothetical protein
MNSQFYIIPDSVYRMGKKIHVRYSNGFEEIEKSYILGDIILTVVTIEDE